MKKYRIKKRRKTLDISKNNIIMYMQNIFNAGELEKKQMCEYIQHNKYYKRRNNSNKVL